MSRIDSWIVNGRKKRSNVRRDLFAKWFVEQQRKRKLTQVRCAAALGTTQQTVSRYGSGKQLPSRKMLPTLLDFFGVSEEQFFGSVSE